MFLLFSFLSPHVFSFAQWVSSILVTTSDHLSERASIEVQTRHNRCMQSDEEQMDQESDKEGGDDGDGGMALGEGDGSQGEAQCEQEQA